MATPRNIPAFATPPEKRRRVVANQARPRLLGVPAQTHTPALTFKGDSASRSDLGFKTPKSSQSQAPAARTAPTPDLKPGGKSRADPTRVPTRVGGGSGIGKTIGTVGRLAGAVGVPLAPLALGAALSVGKKLIGGLFKKKPKKVALPAVAVIDPPAAPGPVQDAGTPGAFAAPPVAVPETTSLPPQPIPLGAWETPAPPGSYDLDPGEYYDPYQAVPPQWAPPPRRYVPPYRPVSDELAYAYDQGAYGYAPPPQPAPQTYTRMFGGYASGDPGPTGGAAAPSFDPYTFGRALLPQQVDEYYDPSQVEYEPEPEAWYGDGDAGGYYDPGEDVRGIVTG